MKTQTEMSLMMLGLVVVIVIAYSIYSAGQVDLAASQVGATAAAEKLPEAAVIGGQVTGWALKTLLGVLGLALATGLVAWVRQWWRVRNSKRAWRSGPNAQWQPSQERGPRTMSGDEMLRLMLMQQMMGNRQKNQAESQRSNDDLPLKF
jgi:hypothetical protein